jgi:hypothetical protein
MTAERRCAAADDSVHHLAVLEREMESVSFPKAAARCAEDVGHLEGGWAHRFARLLECFSEGGICLLRHPRQQPTLRTRA